MANSKRWTGR